MRRHPEALGAAVLSRSAPPVVLVAIALAPLVGCKSKPEKICANLEAMVGKEAPDKPLSAEEKAKCASDIQSELDGCENADTIAACYLEAKKIDDIAACESKCAKKRAPPAAKRAASSAPARSAAPADGASPAE